jgi:hypothetical protein
VSDIQDRCGADSDGWAAQRVLRVIGRWRHGAHD